jgi:glyoxylase I family protein
MSWSNETGMTLFLCISPALVLIAGCAMCPVRLEHVALNVAEPEAMAKWYCEHLGMKVMREGPPPANARFITDAGGNMMLELYKNPPEAIPDYRSMNVRVLHIAFMVNDVKAIRDKLVAAGATVAEDIEVTPTGDAVLILRDPWGVPIQFLKRAKPMLKGNWGSGCWW